MVTTAIHMIAMILVIAIGVWGGEKICVKFKLPDPVFWLVGGLLLIILLLFVLSATGLYQGRPLG